MGKILKNDAPRDSVSHKWIFWLFFSFSRKYKTPQPDITKKKPFSFLTFFLKVRKVNKMTKKKLFTD